MVLRVSDEIAVDWILILTEQIPANRRVINEVLNFVRLRQLLNFIEHRQSLKRSLAPSLALVVVGLGPLLVVLQIGFVKLLRQVFIRELFILLAAKILNVKFNILLRLVRDDSFLIVLLGDESFQIHVRVD